MEFDNKYPIYRQLFEMLLSDIINGKLKPGDKFISIREASSKYNLNPNTVTNAFKELELHKIAVTKRGLGTFVTEDTEVLNNLTKKHSEKIVDDFLSKMYSLGYKKDEIISIIHERGEKNE
ncbi:GntR family transcriptional regulator [Streptobacillus felis]|uniref:GntR family transcriptional regulator n=1 Tax=Streptobacillus felis TaxID=1384509 RepID=A0A7Z0PHC3_9FUSO|nr:GntR family transcriptional regulator [Streptobacillus felis]NYV28260.1 GntR family transcriptional regulator [Streptobacillus felis]